MNPYASTGSVKTVTSSIMGSAGGEGRGGRDGVTGASVSAVLRWLAPYLRPCRMVLVIAVACSIITVVAQLLIPLIIGRGIDVAIGAGAVDFSQLGGLVALLALATVVAAFTQWLYSLLMGKIVYDLARRLRLDAFAKLERLALAEIDARPHGDLMSRVVNDVDQVGDGLLQGMTQAVSGVVTIAGTLVLMLLVSVPMAIAVLVATPLSLAAAALITRYSSKSFAAQQAIQGELSAHIEEYVTNQVLVSAFHYEDRARARFGELNRRLQVVGERAQFISSLSNPGTRFVNNLIYAAVAALGCLCVLTGVPGPLSVGGVQVFLSYANQYTKPFNEITGVVSQVQTAMASARRLMALLAASEESDEGATCTLPSPMTGDVAIEHVSFSYDGLSPILCDICLHAAPGQRVALVGPTGCGKTTLINLLLRFYDVDKGIIALDGCDIRQVPRDEVRRAFGMVLQDTWLFGGTVHDNIAYARPGATRGEVIEAARRAHAHAFIEALPQGYDTVLAGGAAALSEGQKQLLCIARVMLSDPTILVLDEATSSIDTRTEQQVQAAFDELMRGRTSIVVAHRLSTIKGADCILVMRDGRIVECGTHDELLAARGAYAELYQSQFSQQ